MIVENMAGSHLVEMYGYDPELMGFSLKKIGRGITKAAKYTVSKPGRALAVISAPATGGLSLLATKKGRDAVGSAARFTQKKILRPTGGAVMTVGRNPMVQKVAGAAARAGAAYVTGGASEAALLASKNMMPKKGRGGLPVAARTGFAPAGAGGLNFGALRDRLARAGRAAATAATDTAFPPPVEAPAPAGKGVSMPLLLGIGGGAAALLVLAVAMSKKGA